MGGTTATVPHSLMSGLLGYWKMDHSTGTTVTDSTGVNTGTRSTNAAWAAGYSKYALDLAGDTYGYVGISSSMFLGKVYDKFSVSFWINLDSTASTRGKTIYFFGVDGTNGSVYPIYIMQDSADNKIYLRMYTLPGLTALTVNSSTALTDTSAWHHIVAVSEGIGGYIKLYVDNTAYTDDVLISQPLIELAGTYIGWPTTSCVDGLIDEVGIWNKALSATEVSALYNTGAPLVYPFQYTLGDEMIRNGTFTDSSYWTADTGWSITDGVGANFLDTTNNALLKQTDDDNIIPFEIGGQYLCTFDLTIPTGNAYLAITNYANTIFWRYWETFTASGSYSRVLSITNNSGIPGASAGFAIRGGTADNAFTITNISVKKLIYGQVRTELIRNGTFDSSDYWDITDHWTIGSGVATYDDVATGTFGQSDANLLLPMKTNTYYCLSFTVTGGTWSVMTILNYAHSVAYVAETYYPTGRNIVYFTTPSNIFGGGIDIRAFITSTTSFTLDNISLKEITPYT